ncbi:MAG: 50S ribosomal protein L25 [Bdellovibrio sp.]|nr:50S ribosomal protein L25 [Bdellovibrio sp.]
MVHERLVFTTREKAVNKTAIANWKKQGQVMAAVYGKSLAKTLDVLVNIRQIGAHALHKGSVFPATIDNTEYRLTIEEIQRDLRTSAVTHISFHAAKTDETVCLDVMLKIDGHAVGEKAGGVTLLICDSVSVEGKLDAVPEYISINVENLELNGKITLADVKIPAGLKLKEKSLDKAVVVCHPARAYTAPVEAAPMVTVTPAAQTTT